MTDLVHQLRSRSYSFKIPDPLCEQAADEIERLQLTQLEREAISAGLGALEAMYEDGPPVSRAVYSSYGPTLRELLRRTLETHATQGEGT